VSSSQNPSHSYANPGNYNVTLTATNASGSDDEVKSSFITVLANEDASFSYANTTYCTTDTDPSATITGTVGGIFTSNPVGLSINANSGLIDVSASIIGLYDVTYTTPGSCSDQNVESLEIESCNNVATTKVRNQECGITLSSFVQNVYCEEVIGATNYQWEVSELGGGYFKEYQRGNHLRNISFSYPAFSGVTSGVTYEIRVRAEVGGVWGDYGAICQVTIPLNLSTTKVRNQDCGILLTSIAQNIYCDEVIGATDYEWEVSKVGGGYLKEYQRGNYLRNISFTYGAFSGVMSGQTYDVRVRAKVGNVWGDYNTSCQVTIPNNISTTKVRNQECGSLLSSFTQRIYCDAVTNATDYEWEISEVGGGYFKEYQRGNHLRYISFSYPAFSGVTIGETYEIRVRAKVGGEWGSYDAICQVTAPLNVPNTKVRNQDCGITLSSMSQNIYCDPVSGASDYEWEVSEAGGGYFKEYQRGNHLRNISFSYPNFSNIEFEKTYNVRVRAKVGNVWGNYNTMCQITTPVSSAIVPSSDDITKSLLSESGIYQKSFDAKIYPNPSNGLFSIETSVSLQGQTIEILNSMGQIIYRESKGNAKQLIDLRGMPVGIYFARILEDNQFKLMKKIVIN
jgi:PKD repeat protein